AHEAGQRDPERGELGGPDPDAAEGDEPDPHDGSSSPGGGRRAGSPAAISAPTGSGRSPPIPGRTAVATRSAGSPSVPSSKRRQPRRWIRALHREPRIAGTYRRLSTGRATAAMWASRTSRRGSASNSRNPGGGASGPPNDQSPSTAPRAMPA